MQGLLERARQAYLSPFDIALIYAALGEKDTALVWMAQAVAEYSTWLVYSNGEPRLDPPRSDPRFKNLLHGIAFQLSSRARRKLISFRQDLSGRPWIWSAVSYLGGCAWITGYSETETLAFQNQVILESAHAA